MRTWMIKTPKGKLLKETKRPTQYRSKAAFIGHTDKYWSDLEKQGYRCVQVKVTLTEATK